MHVQSHTSRHRDAFAAAAQAQAEKRISVRAKIVLQSVASVFAAAALVYRQRLARVQHIKAQHCDQM
jgi:hypothetical protein